MKSSVPLFLPPMLAVSGEAFDSESHWFEPKWDGIRCLFHFSARVHLHSRRGRDITAQFPELTQEPILDATDFLVDGELICLGPDGTPSFDRIRDRLLQWDKARIKRSAQEKPAVFVAFDLLYCDGTSLLEMPLEHRRSLLEQRFVASRCAILSPITPREGRALFDAVGRRNMEGIVAKALGSPYLPGRRSSAWIKVRRTRTGRFWVIGYSLSPLGALRSLAVAEPTVDGLRYVGHVGSGLNARLSDHLQQLLPILPQAKPEEYGPPGEGAQRTVWVEAKVPVEIEYLERGQNGRLRHPVFKGLALPIASGPYEEQV